MNSKRTDEELEWSTMSNVENMRVANMPPPWMESNFSNSLYSFNYEPYAGNSYTPANTHTGPVIDLPESEKIINTYQCPNNNNEILTKKKRLTSGQLDALKQSFQEDMKLDSDKKLKLSKQLGLDPRQIAVWFQNHRARWKAKDLEESHDSLRQVHDNVVRENKMLHDEVKKLRGIILKDHLMKNELNVNNNQLSEGSQIYGTDQYNNSMLVSPYCWIPISQPPYP